MAKGRAQSRIFSSRRKKYHLVNAKLSRKKKRKKKTGPHHVLWMITLAIIAVAIAGAGFKLWQFIKNSPKFQISEITVSGEETFSNREIVELGGLKQKMNFFDVNIYAIEKRLEKVPAIKNAKVIKDWNSVLLNIEERQPIATVKSEGTQYFIDESGVAFLNPKTSRDLDLPSIKGLKGEKLASGRKCKSRIMFEVLDIIRLYRDNQLQKLINIDTVEIKPQNDIILWAGSGGLKVLKGAEIRLGNKKFKQQMEYLASILRDRQDPVRKLLELRGNRKVAE